MKLLISFIFLFIFIYILFSYLNNIIVIFNETIIYGLQDSIKKLNFKNTIIILILIIFSPFTWFYFQEYIIKQYYE